ncbi:hypothetical protein D3C80_2217950 [compost metagenome]
MDKMILGAQAYDAPGRFNETHVQTRPVAGFAQGQMMSTVKRTSADALPAVTVPTVDL